MTKIKYKPLFDSIITTANRKMVSSSGIVLSTISGENPLKTTQTVLRVGENTPDYIKEGTVIELNMSSFPRGKVKNAPADVGPDIYEVIPPLYKGDDNKEFMLMSVRNILYVIED